MSGRKSKKNQRLGSSRRGPKGLNRNIEKDDDDGFQQIAESEDGRDEFHTTSATQFDHPPSSSIEQQTSELECPPHARGHKDSLMETDLPERKRKMGSTRKSTGRFKGDKNLDDVRTTEELDKEYKTQPNTSTTEKRHASLTEQEQSSFPSDVSLQTKSSGFGKESGTTLMFAASENKEITSLYHEVLSDMLIDETVGPPVHSIAVTVAEHDLLREDLVMFNDLKTIRHQETQIASTSGQKKRMGSTRRPLGEQNSENVGVQEHSRNMTENERKAEVRGEAKMKMSEVMAQTWDDVARDDPSSHTESALLFSQSLLADRAELKEPDVAAGTETMNQSVAFPLVDSEKPLPETSSHHGTPLLNEALDFEFGSHTDDLDVVNKVLEDAGSHLSYNSQHVSDAGKDTNPSYDFRDVNTEAKKGVLMQKEEPQLEELALHDQESSLIQHDIATLDNSHDCSMVQTIVGGSRSFDMPVSNISHAEPTTPNLPHEMRNTVEEKQEIHIEIKQENNVCDVSSVTCDTLTDLVSVTEEDKDPHILAMRENENMSDERGSETEYAFKITDQCDARDHNVTQIILDVRDNEKDVETSTETTWISHQKPCDVSTEKEELCKGQEHYSLNISLTHSPTQDGAGKMLENEEVRKDQEETENTAVNDVTSDSESGSHAHQQLFMQFPDKEDYDLHENVNDKGEKEGLFLSVESESAAFDRGNEKSEGTDRNKEMDAALVLKLDVGDADLHLQIEAQNKTFDSTNSKANGTEENISGTSVLVRENKIIKNTVESNMTQSDFPQSSPDVHTEALNVSENAKKDFSGETDTILKQSDSSIIPADSHREEILSKSSPVIQKRKISSTRRPLKGKTGQRKGHDEKEILNLEDEPSPEESRNTTVSICDISESQTLTKSHVGSHENIGDVEMVPAEGDTESHSEDKTFDSTAFEEEAEVREVLVIGDAVTVVSNMTTESDLHQTSDANMEMLKVSENPEDISNTLRNSQSEIQQEIKMTELSSEAERTEDIICEAIVSVRKDEFTVDTVTLDRNMTTDSDMLRSDTLNDTKLEALKLSKNTESVSAVTDSVLLGQNDVTEGSRETDTLPEQSHISIIPDDSHGEEAHSVSSLTVHKRKMGSTRRPLKGNKGQRKETKHHDENELLDSEDMINAEKQTFSLEDEPSSDKSTLQSTKDGAKEQEREICENNDVGPVEESESASLQSLSISDLVSEESAAISICHITESQTLRNIQEGSQENTGDAERMAAEEDKDLQLEIDAQNKTSDPTTSDAEETEKTRHDATVSVREVEVIRDTDTLESNMTHESDFLQSSPDAHMEALTVSENSEKELSGETDTNLKQSDISIIPADSHREETHSKSRPVIQKRKMGSTRRPLKGKKGQRKETEHRDENEALDSEDMVSAISICHTTESQTLTNINVEPQENTGDTERVAAEEDKDLQLEIEAQNKTSDSTTSEAEETEKNIQDVIVTLIKEVEVIGDTVTVASNMTGESDFIQTSPDAHMEALKISKNAEKEVSGETDMVAEQSDISIIPADSHGEETHSKSSPVIQKRKIGSTCRPLKGNKGQRKETEHFDESETLDSEDMIKAEKQTITLENEPGPCESTLQSTKDGAKEQEREICEKNDVEPVEESESALLQSSSISDLVSEESAAISICHITESQTLRNIQEGSQENTGDAERMAAEEDKDLQLEIEARNKTTDSTTSEAEETEKNIHDATVLVREVEVIRDTDTVESNESDLLQSDTLNDAKLEALKFSKNTESVSAVTDSVLLGQDDVTEGSRETDTLTEQSHISIIPDDSHGEEAHSVSSLTVHKRKMGSTRRPLKGNKGQRKETKHHDENELLDSEDMINAEKQTFSLEDEPSSDKSTLQSIKDGAKEQEREICEKNDVGPVEESESASLQSLSISDLVSEESAAISICHITESQTLRNIQEAFQENTGDAERMAAEEDKDLQSEIDAQNKTSDSTTSEAEETEKNIQDVNVTLIKEVEVIGDTDTLESNMTNGSDLLQSSPDAHMEALNVSENSEKEVSGETDTNFKQSDISIFPADSHREETHSKSRPVIQKRKMGSTRRPLKGNKGQRKETEHLDENEALDSADMINAEKQTFSLVGEPSPEKSTLQSLRDRAKEQEREMCEKNDVESVEESESALLQSLKISDLVTEESAAISICHITESQTFTNIHVVSQENTGDVERVAAEEDKDLQLETDAQNKTSDSTTSEAEETEKNIHDATVLVREVEVIRDTDTLESNESDLLQSDTLNEAKLEALKLSKNTESVSAVTDSVLLGQNDVTEGSRETDTLPEQSHISIIPIDFHGEEAHSVSSLTVHKRKMGSTRRPLKGNKGQRKETQHHDENETLDNEDMISAISICHITESQTLTNINVEPQENTGDAERVAAEEDKDLQLEIEAQNKTSDSTTSEAEETEKNIQVVNVTLIKEVEVIGDTVTVVSNMTGESDFIQTSPDAHMEALKISKNAEKEVSGETDMVAEQSDISIIPADSHGEETHSKSSPVIQKRKMGSTGRPLKGNKGQRKETEHFDESETLDSEDMINAEKQTITLENEPGPGESTLQSTKDEAKEQEREICENNDVEPVEESGSALLQFSCISNLMSEESAPISICHITASQTLTDTDVKPQENTGDAEKMTAEEDKDLQLEIEAQNKTSNSTTSEAEETEKKIHDATVLVREVEVIRVTDTLESNMTHESDFPQSDTLNDAKLEALELSKNTESVSAVTDSVLLGQNDVTEGSRETDTLPEQSHISIIPDDSHGEEAHSVSSLTVHKRKMGSTRRPLKGNKGQRKETKHHDENELLDSEDMINAEKQTFSLEDEPSSDKSTLQSTKDGAKEQEREICEKNDVESVEESESASLQSLSISDLVSEESAAISICHITESQTLRNIQEASQENTRDAERMAAEEDKDLQLEIDAQNKTSDSTTSEAEETEKSTDDATVSVREVEVIRDTDTVESNMTNESDLLQSSPDAHMEALNMSENSEKELSGETDTNLKQSDISIISADSHREETHSKSRPIIQKRKMGSTRRPLKGNKGQRKETEHHDENETLDSEDMISAISICHITESQTLRNINVVSQENTGDAERVAAEDDKNLQLEIEAQNKTSDSTTSEAEETEKNIQVVNVTLVREVEVIGDTVTVASNMTAESDFIQTSPDAHMEALKISKNAEKEVSGETDTVAEQSDISIIPADSHGEETHSKSIPVIQKRKMGSTRRPLKGNTGQRKGHDEKEIFNLENVPCSEESRYTAVSICYMTESQTLTNIHAVTQESIRDAERVTAEDGKNLQLEIEAQNKTSDPTTSEAEETEKNIHDATVSVREVEVIRDTDTLESNMTNESDFLQSSPDAHMEALNVSENSEKEVSGETDTILKQSDISTIPADSHREETHSKSRPVIQKRKMGSTRRPLKGNKGQRKETEHRDENEALDSEDMINAEKQTISLENEPGPCESTLQSTKDEAKEQEVEICENNDVEPVEESGSALLQFSCISNSMSEESAAISICHITASQTLTDTDVKPQENTGDAERMAAEEDKDLQLEIVAQNKTSDSTTSEAEETEKNIHDATVLVREVEVIGVTDTLESNMTNESDFLQSSPDAHMEALNVSENSEKEVSGETDTILKQSDISTIPADSHREETHSKSNPVIQKRKMGSTRRPLKGNTGQRKGHDEKEIFNLEDVPCPEESRYTAVSICDISESQTLTNIHSGSHENIGDVEMVPAEGDTESNSEHKTFDSTAFEEKPEVREVLVIGDAVTVVSNMTTESDLHQTSDAHMETLKVFENAEKEVSEETDTNLKQSDISIIPADSHREETHSKSSPVIQKRKMGSTRRPLKGNKGQRKETEHHDESKTPDSEEMISAISICHMTESQTLTNINAVTQESIRDAERVAAKDGKDLQLEIEAHKTSASTTSEAEETEKTRHDAPVSVREVEVIGDTDTLESNMAHESDFLQSSPDAHMEALNVSENSEKDFSGETDTILKQSDISLIPADSHREETHSKSRPVIQKRKMGSTRRPLKGNTGQRKGHDEKEIFSLEGVPSPEESRSTTVNICGISESQTLTNIHSGSHENIGDVEMVPAEGDTESHSEDKTFDSTAFEKEATEENICAAALDRKEFVGDAVESNMTTESDLIQSYTSTDSKPEAFISEIAKIKNSEKDKQISKQSGPNIIPEDLYGDEEHTKLSLNVHKRKMGSTRRPLRGNKEQRKVRVESKENNEDSEGMSEEEDTETHFVIQNRDNLVDHNVTQEILNIRDVKDEERKTMKTVNISVQKQFDDLELEQRLDASQTQTGLSQHDTDSHLQEFPESTADFVRESNNLSDVHVSDALLMEETQFYVSSNDVPPTEAVERNPVSKMSVQKRKMGSTRKRGKRMVNDKEVEDEKAGATENTITDDETTKSEVKLTHEEAITESPVHQQLFSSSDDKEGHDIQDNFCKSDVQAENSEQNDPNSTTTLPKLLIESQCSSNAAAEMVSDLPLGDVNTYLDPKQSVIPKESHREDQPNLNPFVQKRKMGSTRKTLRGNKGQGRIAESKKMDGNNEGMTQEQDAEPHLETRARTELDEEVEQNFPVEFSHPVASSNMFLEPVQEFSQNDLSEVSEEKGMDITGNDSEAINLNEGTKDKFVLTVSHKDIHQIVSEPEQTEITHKVIATQEKRRKMGSTRRNPRAMHGRNMDDNEDVLGLAEDRETEKADNDLKEASSISQSEEVSSVSTTDHESEMLVVATDLKVQNDHLHSSRPTEPETPENTLQICDNQLLNADVTKHPQSETVSTEKRRKMGSTRKNPREGGIRGKREGYEYTETKDTNLQMLQDSEMSLVREDVRKPTTHDYSNQSEDSLLNEIERALNKTSQSPLSCDWELITKEPNPDDLANTPDLNMPENSEIRSLQPIPSTHSEPNSPGGRRRKMGSTRKNPRQQLKAEREDEDKKYGEIDENSKANKQEKKDLERVEVSVVHNIIENKLNKDYLDVSSAHTSSNQLEESTNPVSQEKTSPSTKRKFGSRRANKDRQGFGRMADSDIGKELEDGDQKPDSSEVKDKLHSDDLAVCDPCLSLQPENRPASEQRNMEAKNEEATPKGTGAGLVSLDQIIKHDRSTGARQTVNLKNRIADTEAVQFNVVMVGNSCVGKTSFIRRFHEGQFTEDYRSTIGVDTCVQTVALPDKTVKLQIWDTAGQERFHSITTQVFHKADGLLLMYEITCSKSFISVRDWISQARERAPDDVIMMLLGNKSDSEKREVQIQQGADLAREYNIHFMECSAATGANVSESMMGLAEMLVQRKSQKEKHTTLRRDPPQKKSGCC